jgi:hypothetical protein
MGTPTPPQHRWTIAVLVLALSTAFAGGVWSMTLSPLEERAAGPPPTAVPVAAEQVTATAPHRLRLGATVAGHGSTVADIAGSTWVVGRGVLSTITSRTATVVARGPWSRHAILAPANDGSIWLASGRFLWPVSTWGTVGSRLTPSVGPISAVLAADGRTWVAGSDGMLAWIDPSTGNTIQSYYLGRGASQLAAASDYVFVETADPSQPPLVRLDPALGAAVPVPGAQPGPIAASGGRLGWGAADGVRCVMAKTLQRCGRLDVSNPTILSAHGGALWVTAASTRGVQVALFDAESGRAVAGPVALSGSVAGSIAANKDDAWVGVPDTDAVVRVGRT